MALAVHLVHPVHNVHPSSPTPPATFAPTMPRSHRPFLLFPVLIALLAASAAAHPNGTSKVSIHLLENDSLTVEVDVNTGDMMNAVGTMMSPEDPLDAGEVRAHQQKAAAYAFSRVTLQIDGRSVILPGVLRWKRGGSGPKDDLPRDSAAFWDTSMVLTYGGRLPAGSRALRFEGALFPEFGVQTICEASVYWRDTLIERRWLTLGRSLRMPLDRDSLDARVSRVRESAMDAGDGLFGRFTVLGFTHILPYGADHILFVLGLFFFSTLMRPLLWQVTAFTVAHSITLALTVLGFVSLPERVVEPLIALSIAVVGIENVFFRGVRASRWLIVFGFGLIHGMGFAGVLGDLGLPEGGFWPALIGFNIGVELGQIAVIAIAFALTVWFRGRPWYFRRVVVPVSLLISAVGLYWAVTRAAGW
jgi:hydrogenase/urease accessory protein HupE